jgi:PST family polysaccharide transporter
MSELVRSVGLLSGKQLALMVLGAARTKVAASLLGPAGMGVLAQAATFQDLLRQLSMLGSTNGFLKLFAEAIGRDDRRTIERLVPTALGVFGGIALLCTVAGFAFAKPLARLVFDDEGAAHLVMLCALGVPLMVPGMLIGRMLSGALQFRAFVQLSVVDALVGFAAMATLVWLFGLTGAVASLLVAEATALAFGIWLLWRHVVRPRALVLRPRAPDATIVRRLIRLAGVLALASLTAAGASVFVRSEILRAFGSEANGYYQVAWQVGQNYLGILSTSLWTYGMPKVATKLDDPAAILALQNDFLRIALAVLAPGIVVLLCARELWVPLLYSTAFLAAAPMLSWQLAGELLAMLRQSMNISLLPRERLGFLLFQAVLYWAGWALLSVLLMPRLGAIAVAIAYCAANVVTLLVTFAYHRTALGYRPSAANARLLAVTLPGFAIALWLASGDDLLLARALPLAMVGACIHAQRAIYRDALASLRRG